MAWTKQGSAKGGHTQSERFYICPHCMDIGATNKMIYHIKTCDGSGLKNYWAKKRSNALKKHLASIL